MPERIVRPQGGGQQPMLTDDEVERAVRLRTVQRWSIKRIAAEFHVHPSTMGRYLHRAGVPYFPRHPVQRRMDPEELLRTTELAGQGYSVRDIATLTGAHPSTIRYRLRHYARPGLEWRGRKNRLGSSPSGREGLY